MEPKEFCCEPMARDFLERRIYPSLDEDCDWNVRGADAFTMALENIHFCPYCGNALPTRDEMGQS